MPLHHKNAARKRITLTDFRDLGQILIFCLVGVAGIFGSGNVVARPVELTQTGPALQFVTEPFPPFSYETEGKPAGPMVDVVQAVCREVRVKCVVSVLPWRRALKSAEEGEVDGIFSIARVPEREEKFFMSDSIISSAYSFFAMKDSHWHFKNADDLKNMTVGVYGPSSTANALNELIGATKTDKNVKIELELNNFDVFKKLILGVYGPKSAVVINRDVGRALLKQENFIGPVLAGDIKTIEYAFGLSRQKATAQQMVQLNNALRKLKASGKIQAILAKHGVNAAK